jgi:hypothetical protein
MGVKLGKSEFPRGAGPNDFQCFGPPATEDGQFDKVKIADLGCFDQSGKDSNKYYHAAVVQHKTTKKWYTYFEWGRTGATSPQFQFVECSSESDAQEEFADQLHDKNDKRGMWTTIAGIKTLTAKPNKDCYLVRPMATRSTGLPDGKTIKLNEGAKVTKAPAATVTTDKSAPTAIVKKKTTIDTHTMRLMKDLNVATVSYARGAMADSSLPTQKSIEEARQILQEAQKRLIKVGDSVDKQAADTELVQLTRVMYSRIPKKKALHCAPEDWILNKNNIMLWTADLDAFEAALYVYDDTVKDDKVNDPFQGMPLAMEWIDPTSSTGKFLYNWWPKASANRHYGVGEMKIKNMWKVARHGDQSKIGGAQDAVLREKCRITERAPFQPKERNDVEDNDLIKRYHDTNTALLFHGTRSVNVTGILREGLRLPKQLVGVAITGAMFGPGCYFADDWRKSAGYTSLRGGYYSAGDGGVRGRDAFMFACDVVLGNPWVAPHSGGYTSAPKGHHCVYGKAGKSGVVNNEWIIYDGKQNQLRYLVEFAA